jgi:adenine/guanine phosphoribosyltransferase-like PRPP-binding protein
MLPGGGPVQRAAANRTGLPDGLKAGVEALSGLSMDDVRVHRNSAEPGKMGALAYARGSAIHLGPGQERHLPHEAWHVVQQKRGLVKTTMRVHETPINDDPGLEAEAEAKGLSAQRHSVTAAQRIAASPAAFPVAPLQRRRGEGVIQPFGFPAWASTMATDAATGLASWWRGPAINYQRAQFNRQQPPPPARGVLVRNTVIALNALDPTLVKLPRLRELVDALVALYADAMLMEIQGINAQHVPAKSKARSRAALYKGKRDLLALRLEIEKAYQTTIRAESGMSATAIQQQVQAVKAAGAFLAGRGGSITATLTSAPANKTGRREPRTYHHNGAAVDDRSIDVRAIAIAKAVQADNFVPELVVGLPTGGVQIAARVAGYFHATNLSAPKLMALRPRFVKPPGLGGAITPAEQATINASDVMSAIMSHQLDQPGAPLKILVVDDFSQSGSSVEQAKAQIQAQFDRLGRAVVIRTAVSRYTSAQIGGTIGANEAPNPIDYLAGQHASGTRGSISAQFLVGDDRRNFSALGNQYLGDADKGWLDEGEDALQEANAL